MLFKNKRVFVSGGNGVIGNELIGKLHSAGANILAGDLKPQPRHWPRDIGYRQGDLNCMSKAELDDFAPEYFFHLAATFERSIETYDFWNENYHHNVCLSNYLMGLLKDSVCLKKVIYASSYLIYSPELYNFAEPAQKACRLKESDPICPRNLTGMAKLMHEMELNFLADFKGDKYKIVSARIFRSYGKGSRDIISRWIRALLKSDPIRIYRKEGIFDYIYAGEVAEGLVRLALNTKAEGIVNLGNDNARKVEEVLVILKRHFPKMQMTEALSEITYEASQANMDHFNALTGWKPCKQLEDVIPELITYEKQHEFDENERPAANVLITSISKKVALIKAVKNAAKKIGSRIKVYGGDASPACLGKYFVDVFWQMPEMSSLSVELLVSYCRQNDIRFIIPTRDGELTYFAKCKDQLAKSGIEVMVSIPAAVENCLDKVMFYAVMKKHGFPVIYTSERLDDIDSNKLVVKDRFGAGAKGIGLGLDRATAREYAKTINSPVFQPLVEGFEASVDLYIGKNKKVKGVIARKRDLIVNGESQITTTFNNNSLEKMCVRIVDELGVYGHVVLQVLIDTNNKFHIIECNCRFGGASTLSVASGLDSFYWFLLEASGADIAGYPFIRSKSNKIQIRYPEDQIFNDSSI